MLHVLDRLRFTNGVTSHWRRFSRVCPFFLLLFFSFFLKKKIFDAAYKMHLLRCLSPSSASFLFFLDVTLRPNGWRRRARQETEEYVKEERGDDVLSVFLHPKSSVCLAFNGLLYHDVSNTACTSCPWCPGLHVVVVSCFYLFSLSLFYCQDVVLRTRPVILCNAKEQKKQKSAQR